MFLKTLSASYEIICFTSGLKVRFCLHPLHPSVPQTTAPRPPSPVAAISYAQRIHSTLQAGLSRPGRPRR
jgi:hypothetical protein